MLEILIAAQPELPVRTVHDQGVLVTVLHLNKQSFV